MAHGTQESLGSAALCPSSGIHPERAHLGSLFLHCFYAVSSCDVDHVIQTRSGDLFVLFFSFGVFFSSVSDRVK